MQLKRFLVSVILLIVISSVANAAIQVTDNKSLCLSFAPDGSIKSLISSGKELLAPGMFSGLSIEDKTTGIREDIKGTVTQSDDNVQFSGRSTKLQLIVTATFKSAKGRIIAKVTVKDLTGKDRAIDADFLLRLKDLDWIWCEDLYRSYTARVGEWNLSRGTYAYHAQSTFPLAAVSTPGGSGLAVCWPMDNPRFYSQTYTRSDKGYGDFRMSVPLGISKLTDKFPSKADFDIVVYEFNGQERLRGALSEYYKLYPDCFKLRVKKQGLWTLWLNKGAEKYADRMGVLIDEAEYDLSGPANIVRDEKKGYMSFQYSEPWGLWHPIPSGWREKQTLPTYDTVSPYESPMPQKEFESMIKENLGDKAPDDRFPGVSRDYITKAILNSVVYRDQESNWLVYLWVKGFGWGERKDWDRVVVQTNPDPEIPHPNRSDVAWEGQYMYAERMAAKEKAHLDGLYVDSAGFMMGWDQMNFRKDHWKYADFPLTYKTMKDGSTQVCQAMALTDADYLRSLQKAGAKRNWPVLMNGWYPLYVHCAAFVDILGAGETGADEARVLVGQWHLGYFRAMAYHKPVSNMDYMISLFMLPPTKENLDKIEARINHYVLYGIYPGTANGWASDMSGNMDLLAPIFEKYKPIFLAINYAGWEPNNCVTMDNELVDPGKGMGTDGLAYSDKSEAVICERWGSNVAKGLYYTLYNQSDKPRTVHVNVNLKALHSKTPTSAEEMISGQKLDLNTSKGKCEFTITINPSRSVAVKLGI